MKNSDLVAQFLAKGGTVTRAPEGVAYGVDAAADKAKRKEARARVEDNRPYLAAVDHLGRGWYRNAEGEIVGHD